MKKKAVSRLMLSPANFSWLLVVVKAIAVVFVTASATVLLRRMFWQSDKDPKGFLPVNRRGKEE